MHIGKIFGGVGLACIVSASIAQAAVTATTNQPTFSAHYVMRARSMDIAEITWHISKLDTDVYAYETRSHSVGIAALIRKVEVTERSEWRRDKYRITPLTYSLDRRGKKARKVQMRFDWDSSIAYVDDRGAKAQLELKEGFQDKLSYLMQLMRDLKSRGTAGHPFRYTVADGRKLKNYTVEITGEEYVETEAGSYRTITLLRQRAEAGARNDRQTTLWLAPDLQYLPVQIRHREKDGEVIELILTKIEGLPPA